MGSALGQLWSQVLCVCVRVCAHCVCVLSQIPYLLLWKQQRRKSNFSLHTVRSKTFPHLWLGNLHKPKLLDWDSSFLLMAHGPISKPMSSITLLCKVTSVHTSSRGPPPHRDMSVKPDVVFYVERGESHQDSWRRPKPHTFKSPCSYWPRLLNSCFKQISDAVFFSRGPLLWCRGGICR